MALARCRTSMFRTALRSQTSSVASPYIRFNSTAAAAESSSAAAAATADPATDLRKAALTPQSTDPSMEKAMNLISEHGLIPVRHSYFVPRVGRLNDSLPVYTDVRNGGTRIMTEVRRVEGNLVDLRNELRELLASNSDPLSRGYKRAQAALEAKTLADEINQEPHIPYLPHNGRTPNRIKVNRKSIPTRGHPSALDPVQPSVVIQSGKLKIRGNRVRQIKQFLEEKGF